MTLEPLTREDAEQVRIWRNLPEMQATLRTAKRLTYDEQQDWYTREIANRESHTRYWALTDGLGAWGLLGYGGIEHISWENRNGEMSLLIAPDKHDLGLGARAVGLFLNEAFGNMNLHTVHGECYLSGPWRFWERMVKKYSGVATMLPCRKYYQGKYYYSYYFTFFREALGYGSDLCNPGERGIEAAAKQEYSSVQ